jgi:protein-S-isoprenylcysteine O-methyltransferase Ste14
MLYMLIIGGGWLIILPLGVLFIEHGHFAVPLRPTLLVDSGLVIGSVGAVLALVAGYHLIVHGQGTPLPLDPPQRLVTTGPYAYVRNPQAIAMLLMVCGETLIVRSWLLWCMLPLTLLYLEVLVGPWEERQLIRQHAESYVQYRRQVHKWLPRSRPYHPQAD